MNPDRTRSCIRWGCLVKVRGPIWCLSCLQAKWSCRWLSAALDSEPVLFGRTNWAPPWYFWMRGTLKQRRSIYHHFYLQLQIIVCIINLVLRMATYSDFRGIQSEHLIIDSFGVELPEKGGSFYINCSVKPRYFARHQWKFREKIAAIRSGHRIV